MSELRVLLVTRRFWPLVGDAENNVAELATGLLRFGHRPTVLTAAWHSSWPREVSFDGVPVARLPLTAESRWGNWRYMKSLKRWLRARRHEFDLICVSRLRYDAYAILSEARPWNMPVVVRADDSGDRGAGRWLLESRAGKRLHKRLLSADAIIVSSDAAAAELRQANFTPSQLRIIAPATRLVTAADVDRSFDARIALADANPDLITTNETPVAVYIGRLKKNHNLDRLVRAWSAVLWRYPNARLWLIGDGPLRADLYHLVRDLDLQRSVFLPGTFDDIEGVLQAANAVVDPKECGAVSMAVLRSIAAGLPTIAIDRPELHATLPDPPLNVRLLPRCDISLLRDALLDALSERLRVAPPNPARRELLKTHSPRTMIAKHIDLFRELLAARA